jgi:phage tail-like protein
MRGGVPGLQSPLGLGMTLPGIYQDDGFVQELCAGLDEVLAPLVATLDCLPAYLDPETTPPDVLEWLAGWIGIVLDDVVPERRRVVIRRAAELHRWRGTARGVRTAVAVWCGVEPELVESGGSGWSAEGGAPLPGDPEPSLLVRVRVPDPAVVDAGRLDALVAATKPVHVPHRVEVLPVG